MSGCTGKARLRRVARRRRIDRSRDPLVAPSRRAARQV